MVDLFIERGVFLVSLLYLGWQDHKTRGAPTYMFVPLGIATGFIAYFNTLSNVVTHSLLWVETDVGLTALIVILGWLFLKGFGSGDVIALICFVWAFPIGSMFVGVGLSFLLSIFYRNKVKGVPYVSFLSVGAIISFILSFVLHGIWLF